MPRKSSSSRWMTRSSPAALINSNLAGYRLRVNIDKRFGDWHIDRGSMLLYIADRAINAINMRTDVGRGVDGQFRPYAPRRGIWKRDDDGNLLADASGKRVELPPVEDPRTVVSLRSLQEVSENKRMRDWLRISPARPAPSATSIKIVQSGGRKTGSGVHVGHRSRALRCVDTQRRHIALTGPELELILSSIRYDLVAAFIKRRSRGLLAKEYARAHSKARRQIARTRRAAKRARLTAQQRQRQYVIRAKRMGIVSGDAREQYKASRRQKRIDKRK